jgi:opacity protein-like surface antigen
MFHSAIVGTYLGALVKFKLATLALMASVSGAVAADMPAGSYSKAPIISAAYNWSGFYVGAMGGYAWSDEVTVGITGIGRATTASNELKGGFGGGTIGYNWQAPGSQFVFGIEADAAGAGIRYSEGIPGIYSLETKIEAFGTVTGRAGFAVDNALFYVKGGYAWASNRAIKSQQRFPSSASLPQIANFTQAGLSVVASNTGSPGIGRLRSNISSSASAPKAFSTALNSAPRSTRLRAASTTGSPVTDRSTISSLNLGPGCAGAFFVSRWDRGAVKTA